MIGWKKLPNRDELSGRDRVPIIGDVATQLNRKFSVDVHEMQHHQRDISVYGIDCQMSRIRTTRPASILANICTNESTLND